MRISDWGSDGCSSDLAYRQLPFYRDRLAEAGFVTGKPVTPAVWARIPVLTRGELQVAGPALFCAELPSGHGHTYELSTSGSTGRPVKAKGTSLVQLIWQAITLREHLWHRRDFSGTLAAIRSLPSGAGVYPQGDRRSEEHTSELQSLMRISYAVFCLKKK